MVWTTDAVYENGTLRLLKPLPLRAGQTVQIAIQSPSEILTDDELDHRLQVMGLWYEVDVPDDALEVSPNELDRLAQLFASPTLMADEIIADRGID